VFGFTFLRLFSVLRKLSVIYNKIPTYC